MSAMGSSVKWANGPCSERLSFFWGRNSDDVWLPVPKLGWRKRERASEQVSVHFYSVVYRGARMWQN